MDFVFRNYQPGDLIGFSACSALGVGINVCTLGLPFWGLSHVGIIAGNPDTWEPVLWESTALIDRPCLVRRRRVDGVQCHRIRTRLKTYCGRAWLYRLKQPLAEREGYCLTSYLYSNLGRDYDYLGALRARETPLGWMEQWLCPENLHSLFCSELAAAAYRRVGRLNTANCSKWSPNRLARTLVRQGITLPPIRLK